MTPEAEEIVLSLIIPVRNDAPSIEVMTRILSAMVRVKHELIVVYDDPADDSVPVIARMQPAYPSLHGVLNTAGRGVLNAIRFGVRTARGKYVMIYAADEIGPVLAIDRMLQLMQNGCDFVSATRYRWGGRRYGGSMLGHALSWTANWLFVVLSASAFTDCTTGIKMFRRAIFDKLNLTGEGGGWSFAFEMGIKAQTLGLTLGEVPIVSIDRLFGGQSTFRPIPWIISYSRWFLWGLKTLPPWTRPRPRLMAPAIPRP
jgi:dolichol-phosphate mannosyltransferase